MRKPKLYIFVGYPGAGKTTTALIIKEMTNARHIWVDLERKARFGGQDFTPNDTEELYRELDVEIETYLQRGEDVIFDTNINMFKDRQFLKDLAERNNAETVLIWLTTDKEISRKRAYMDFVADNLRVLGAMNDQTFDKIANRLQKPSKSENPIKVDGAKTSRGELVRLLGLGTSQSTF